MAEPRPDPGVDIPSSEAELVRRAKLRDPQVWAAWHDENYALIFRYALARLRNREEAEDLASMVFLEAIKSIGGYTYRGRPVLAWFYGIARNLVSKRLRERGRQQVWGRDEADEGPMADSHEAAVVDRLWLLSVLGSLKDEHREVLILRYVLQLPTPEIARVLGKQESAVYSLQARAVQALRRTVDEDRAEILLDRRIEPSLEHK
jgi:RNA polymerase sigma-70 factor (ECF subfamily)